MDLEQLTGRYRRLKEELARAYSQQPWPTGRIDRLAQEISETELAIAALPAESPVGSEASASEAEPEEEVLLMPTAPTHVAKTAGRTPSVARNRLTPFGQHIPEHAGE